MSVAIILTGVAVLVVLIAAKLHTLLALLIATIVTGLMSGMAFTKVMASVTVGVGSTLGSVALILALGAMYGKFIEETGIAKTVVHSLSGSFKGKNIQWAVLATGIIVGIPLFYNAGFVILIPLVFTLAVTLKIPVLYVGLPMATALSVTHGFLPPHPGPAALVGVLHANMGKTIYYGLIIGIPVAIICGIFITRLIVPFNVSANITQQTMVTDEKKLPGKALSFFLALLPVLIIGLGTAGTIINKSFIPFSYAQEPVFAFVVSILAMMLLLKLPFAKAADMSSDGIRSVALILMIIAGGGAFKQILIDSGTADGVVQSATSLHLSPLLFGWMIAALLRLAIGSSTVASLTASGLVLSLMKSGVSAELMVLAIGAGSVFGSHVNDTGFWMFKEYFGLTLRQTFGTWTLIESCISVLGLVGVLTMSGFL